MRGVDVACLGLPFDRARLAKLHGSELGSWGPHGLSVISAALVIDLHINGSQA